jgi:hypothetical protein
LRLRLRLSKKQNLQKSVEYFLNLDLNLNLRFLGVTR